MKKLMIPFFIILFIAHTATFTMANEGRVDYEKYGRIATVVVKEDYPNEEVVEYEYQGRQKISDTRVVDTFKFQVKENGKLVNVLVKITHLPGENKFLNLTVEQQ